MTTNRFAILALLPLQGLAGCAGSVTDPGSPDPGGAASQIVVAVEPEAAEVAPGGTVRFAASVTGTSDTAVGWSVEEGATGGTVSAEGVYTAPAASGTYHVAAAARADAKKRHVVPVKVTPKPSVAVAVTPRTASVAAGGRQTFTATVTGSANTTVSWSMAEPSGCGSVSSAGVYTAPVSAATCHVVATSAADPARGDVATVTVTASPAAVTVTLAPSSAAVDACQPFTFRATVTGSPDTAVAWSVQEGAAGGSITASGTYTAPATAGTYHVVATSHAAPATSAIVPVTVTDRVLSVVVSPQQISVPANGSATFTATVTTSCGSFASLRTVSSAGAVSGP